MPGSVPSLQEAAGCWKGMCPGLQLHFRPAVLGEFLPEGSYRTSFQLGHAFDWCTLASRDVSYEDMLDRASVVGRCLIRKKHLYWNRHTTHVRAVMGTSPNLGGWIFLSPTSPSLPKTSSARRGRSWTPRSDAPSGDNSGERFQDRPISSNKETYLGSHPNRRLYFTIYNVQLNLFFWKVLTLPIWFWLPVVFAQEVFSLGILGASGRWRQQCHLIVFEWYNAAGAKYATISWQTT